MILVNLVVSNVLTGCDSKKSFEAMCEMALIYIARQQRSRHHSMTLVEELTSFSNPHVFQVCMRRKTDLTFKRTRKVIRAQRDQIRKPWERHILAKVSLYVFTRCSDRRPLPSNSPRCDAGIGVVYYESCECSQQ